jgi:hypothetical protein
VGAFTDILRFSRIDTSSRRVRVRLEEAAEAAFVKVLVDAGCIEKMVENDL